MSEMNGQTSIAEIVQRYPATRAVFDRHGLKGCGGANGPREALSFFAKVHTIDLSSLLEELNEVIALGAKAELPMTSVMEADVEDTLYRRFFKAGIVVVLTVGCLWGAINLAQIAFAHTFLQLGLLPSIHAHAHAMIFGWVGLFVMGFAYHAFPRFKGTSLWHPQLASFSFWALLVGIICGMWANMLLGHAIALALGALSAASEMTAVILFLIILRKTSRKSSTPRAPHEAFIGMALFWMLIGTVGETIFFFAKAFSSGEQQMVMRIAMIDGPLRDIQLFGFAGLMIAAVSQRLVPLIYGLQTPKHSSHRTIFLLMNGSLLLGITSYVLMLVTWKPIFAFGLELAYLLMPVWALLLARQLGIFSKPTQVDRTFKFVRAAYLWLIVACAMLPYFLLYGAFTHQIFAHTFMGSHRHAYTVGFVSMMILGVASRVVPTLNGVDPAKLNSLWGPFVLLNIGCAGRVFLQILTDFIPSVAFPLVGLTGFIELTALIWWGVGLWRTMNASQREKTSAPSNLVQISLS